MKVKSMNFKTKEAQALNPLSNTLPQREDINYTLSSGRGSSKKSKAAFTLAEVVITLVVIGVVAAITVPLMNNSAADKKWNAARQKARATIGEAFRLMTINGEITTQKANGTTMTTEDFVKDVIPKYLKLEKTCAPADYNDCGFPSTVKTPKGVTVDVAPNNYKWSELTNSKVWKNFPSGPDNWNSSRVLDTYANKYGTYNTSYYFRTLDGFSVAFLYNPYCVGDTRERYTYYDNLTGGAYYVQQSMDVICLMGIYDMNGKQGPNKVGMDIGFVGSFYNSYQTSAAAVLPHGEEKKDTQVPNATGKYASYSWDKLNNYCNNLGKNNDWIMPDVDETSLISLNYRLVANAKSVERWYFTRSPLGAPDYFSNGRFQADVGGFRGWNPRSLTDSLGPYVRCVRNTALK